MSDWVGNRNSVYKTRAITPTKSEKKTITMQPIR